MKFNVTITNRFNKVETYRCFSENLDGAIAEAARMGCEPTDKQIRVEWSVGTEYAVLTRFKGVWYVTERKDHAAPVQKFALAA